MTGSQSVCLDRGLGSRPAAWRGPRILAAAGVCAVLLFSLGGWGLSIGSKRPWVHPVVGFADSYSETAKFHPWAATSLLAGFRGLAADLLWLKADSYWHHGQWQRMLPLYYLVVALQPRFTTAWSVGGWHMAYNLSEMARRNPEIPAEQRKMWADRWLQQGLSFLKTGLRYNQDKPDIYFDLGWTYYDKALNYPVAVRYLKQAVLKSNSLLNLKVLAHACEKAGLLQEALDTWKTLDQRGDSVARRFIVKLEKELAERGK